MPKNNRTGSGGIVSINNPCAVEGKATGKRPARSDPRNLLFARFAAVGRPPKRYDPWKRRTAFMPRTFGNRTNGCCTRASQAQHMLRLERVETKRTPEITDAEVLRVYYDMTARLYGGGDTGAYELDALNEWRRPETAISDAAGHALTIDAFTRVNQLDHDEVKTAIALSGKWGVKLCLNLPNAFKAIDPPAPWDVAGAGNLTGDWEPGSWGGHSLYADAYNETGVRLVHTWYEGLGLPKTQWPTDEQWLTWGAPSAYCDEMYFVIDSLDAWRKRTAQKLSAKFDMSGVVKAVNKVSSHPIGGRRRNSR